MLLDEIRRRMMAALKAGNTVEKEILGVAVGEITTAEASGKVKSDDDVVAIVRKLVKSDEETLGLATDEAQKRTLAEEIRVLRDFLPKTLAVPQIVEALAPVRDAIRAAGNDGQATGVAMKHLKAQGATVDGKDVTQAVKQMRG